LFTIKPDCDDLPLEGLFKAPINGYGRVALEFKLHGHPNIANLISDLVHLSTAMAFRFVEHLEMKSRANLHAVDYQEGEYSSGGLTSNDNDLDAADDPNASKNRPGGSPDAQDNEGSGDIRAKASSIDRNRVIAAFNLLFNAGDIELHQVEEYERLYAKSPLNFDMCALGGLRRLLDNLYKDRDEVADKLFRDLIPTIRYLTVLICALAHVCDLKSASGLPLCTTLQVLEELHLAKELLFWNGKRIIFLPEDSCFDAIALLMLGGSREIDPYSTGLVCSRGWSVYLSTFADTDPSFTEQGTTATYGSPDCKKSWRVRRLPVLRSSFLRPTIDSGRLGQFHC
jgi:hypothetical protein